MLPLPHNRLPDWESHDASAWREFLASPTGQKLFPLALADRPVLRGNTVEETALNAKTLEGFYAAITFLSTLAAPVEKETNNSERGSAYPALEVDALWDGPKLNNPNPSPE